MQCRQKLTKCFSHAPISTCNSEIIIDFLKYVHNPTPHDIKNYKELAEYYWTNVVRKIGFRPGACTVTVVIDKPDYLPITRNVIHAERKKGKHEVVSYSSCQVDDFEAIFLGTNHTTAIADPLYKANLLAYLARKFIYFA
jgi:hypothetical protein